MDMDKKIDTSKYTSKYSEKSYFNKLVKCAQSAGFKVIHEGLQLYFVAQKPECPKEIKAAIMGTLGYFIFPIDLVPDPVPGIGFADDGVALATTLTMAHMYIDDTISEEAIKKMSRLFGEEKVRAFIESQTVTEGSEQSEQIAENKSEQTAENKSEQLHELGFRQMFKLQKKSQKEDFLVAAVGLACCFGKVDGNFADEEKEIVDQLINNQDDEDACSEDVKDIISAFVNDTVPFSMVKPFLNRVSDEDIIDLNALVEGIILADEKITAEELALKKKWDDYRNSRNAKK